MRAERRWGELYQPAAKPKGGRLFLTGCDPQPVKDAPPTLKEMSVTKTQSVKWQSLAAIPWFSRRFGDAAAKPAPTRERCVMLRTFKRYPAGNHLGAARRGQFGAVEGSRAPARNTARTAASAGRLTT